MPVSWDDNASHDARTITVRFDCARNEHAQAWHLFQTHALGVAAAAPLQVKADVAATSGHKTATTNAPVRTRVLSLPEAFYALTAVPTRASFAAPEALGSLAQIWERFSRASPEHFQRHFAVHHHFRSLGWRLKSGLHYGGHYVLYRGAASAFHSEYIVHVHAAGEALSWSTTQALTRVAADAKKTVLLCDVAVAVTAADAQRGDNAAASDDTRSLIDTLGTDASIHTAAHCRLDEALARGSYAFFRQRVDVAVAAIRFWDIAATAEASSLTVGRAPSASPSFAFAPQPVVAKKPPASTRQSKKPNKRSRTAAATAAAVTAAAAAAHTTDEASSRHEL